jgi:hypothetical protein
VTYNRAMFRVLLLVIPLIAVVGLAILLDRIDAGPGVGFVGLCLISVFTGIGIGLSVGRENGSRRRRPVVSASRRAARAGR